MEQEKYGFVYIWYDRYRKIYYIGSHWGNENDGYICSSNRMRDAYRRRPNDFKRRILKTNINDRKQTLIEEHKWLQLIDENDLGKKYYNLRQHQWGHWSTDQNSLMTIGEKISRSMKGKNLGKIISDEVKTKISKANLGKKRTKEAKQKMSMIRIGTPGPKISDSGKEKLRKINTGKKLSEETKKKISMSKKGQIPTEYNIMKRIEGTKRYWKEKRANNQ